MTFFDIIPTDLLTPLLLFQSKTELIHLIPKLATIYVFEKLFDGKIFWKELWKRDISSFILPPEPNMALGEYSQIIERVQSVNMFWTIGTLIEKGYDILFYHLFKDMLSYSGTIAHALSYAAKNGHIPIVVELLKTPLSDHDYNWALRAAASGNHVEVLKLLLPYSATDYGNALSFAVYQGCIETFNELIAVIDRKNYGITNKFSYSGHLDLAAEYGQIEIVKLLLNKDGNDYDQAIKTASKRGHTEIVKLIESHKSRK